MPDAQFTVPYPEHTHFVGREDDLARLHAALQGEGPVGINPAALGNPTGVTGQGGIGKTQLAVAYAYRYRQHYPDGVYWLNAAESLWSEFANLGRHFLGQGGETALKVRLWETLRTRFKVEEIRDLCFELGINYEEFSPQLGLSSLARELIAYCERRGQLVLLEAAVRRLRGELTEPQAQDELVAHAFARLRERPQCLLILDNVAEPAALDEPLTGDCMPARLPGRILLTTRRRDLGRFRPVELKTLPPDTALALLLRDPRRAAILDPAHPEHETARDICAVFGYLPLALEIAAAHLARKKARSLGEYRYELKARGALDVAADPRVDVHVRHETGLLAALAAQWKTLSQEAQMLLRVAGQLPEATYIPSARLGLLAGISDQVGDFFAVTLTDALMELGDVSLTEELTSDQVRLHPLIRVFAQKQVLLTAEFCEECIHRLLAAFSDIETVEQQCDARGIDALIADLIAAETLFTRAMFIHETRIELTSALRAYLRVFQREAHNLRGWERSNAPGFLAQQLHNRLIYNNMPALFGDLISHLRSCDPVWLVRWADQRQSPQWEMTLTGHVDEVRVVAVTQKGRRAVSGSIDGTLIVWDLVTGRAERMLDWYGGSVNAIAIMPDGQHVVAGSEDGNIVIWNLSTGQAEQILRGHGGRIKAVAVTPDGRQIVSGSVDSTLRIWDIATGQVKRTLSGHQGAVNAVTITLDGQWVLSGSRDQTVRVWELTTGHVKQTLSGLGGRVNTLAVTPDGQMIITGGADGLVRIYDFDTGATKHVLAGHKDWIRSVSVTSDGRWLISGSDDGSLRMWDLATGQEQLTLYGHGGEVTAVAAIQNQLRVISGSSDRTLKTWNLWEGLETPQTLEGRDSWPLRVFVPSLNGDHATFCLDDGTIQFWNLANGRLEHSVPGPEPFIYDAVVEPNGRLAVFGSHDGTVIVWNLESGKPEIVLQGHKEAVLVVTATQDARNAISGSRDGTIMVWNLKTGKAEQTLHLHNEWVLAVAIAPNGQQVVSGSIDGTLKVWELVGGEVRHILSGYRGSVRSIAVTPNGRQIVSASDDGTVSVWNISLEQLECTLHKHNGAIMVTTLSPDGQRVVSGSIDRMVKLWELKTGRDIASAALDGSITCLAIAAIDPIRIIVGDAAGSIYYLQLMEGE